METIRQSLICSLLSGIVYGIIILEHSVSEPHYFLNISDKVGYWIFFLGLSNIGLR